MEAFKKIAIEAASKAGEAIMLVYANSFEVERKADKSPLTLADKNAHNVISEYLKRTDFPILSEEGSSIAYEQRKDWNIFWMVDPLDGTKEFVKRNGEFTVNIALIENGRPVFGVVYAPVLDKLYYGGHLEGAFRIHNGSTKPLDKYHGRQRSSVGIVASRSHLNEDTKEFIARFETAEIISMGSSLKFMVLAEGGADYYPRFAPTMEWDTAAAHAIVDTLGFEVVEPRSGSPLRYNKEDLLNPYFLVAGKNDSTSV